MKHNISISLLVFFTLLLTSCSTINQDNTQSTSLTKPIQPITILEAKHTIDINDQPNSIIIRSSTTKPKTIHSYSTKPLQLKNGENLIEMALPDKISLIELLDWVGEYLDLDYIYDPAKIKDQPLTLKLHARADSKINVQF